MYKHWPRILLAILAMGFDGFEFNVHYLNIVFYVFFQYLDTTQNLRWSTVHMPSKSRCVLFYFLSSKCTTLLNNKG